MFDAHMKCKIVDCDSWWKVHTPFNSKLFLGTCSLCSFFCSGSKKSYETRGHNLLHDGGRGHFGGQECVEINSCLYCFGNKRVLTVRAALCVACAAATRRCCRHVIMTQWM